MPPKPNSRRAGFRPFWPTAAPPPKDVATAPVQAIQEKLENTPQETPDREEAKHAYLWKLMHNYIPADKESVQSSFVTHIEYTCARSRFNFDKFSAYLAASYSVRDRLIELFNDTQEYFISQKVKQIYYVSIEFLVGRFLRNALLNLELEDVYRESLAELDVSIDNLYTEEYDPGLGNGGLGRLAACFMDSLATLNLPAWGYGLMYSFGMFKQTIGPDGSQMEVPDYWLNYGDPWRVQKTSVVYPVYFYGRCEGSYWHPGLTINAVANDFMIPGFATDNTLGLRLWSSSPAEELDPEKFRYGDYYDAITQKQRAENLTSVLYPNDNSDDGKEMRLMQEFFMSSATLQDIIHKLKFFHKADIHELPNYAAVQLNDTHPAVMVAELLRILVDEERLTFRESYEICTKVFSYTCHTLMPEALEKWNVNLFEKVLPRHLQIIYELNQMFLEELRYKYRVNDQVVSSLSIIEEGYCKQVRMANLAVIGSHTVNGVAAIHSELMKQYVFKDFAELWPTKFQNKTNGVTVRRWLHHCNPELSNLITQVVGDENWALTTNGLTKLMTKLNDVNYCGEWAAVKHANKQRLANYIYETMGVRLNPSVQLFDVQVKRIHEYKRQTLNILGVIDRYLNILDGNIDGMQPRAVLIGGKAAPGYFFAKKLIKLINNVARVINNDSRVGDMLKLLYLPNYNVSLAEMIIPAADINEQISTAGTEASGTSNMKFAFNSSLIVGTWDGANIEIGDAIGNENVFFFGTKVEDVDDIRAGKGRKISHRLSRIFTAIQSGMFGENEYDVIIDSISGKDHYLCGQDFDMFIDIQKKVDEAYQDKDSWIKKCITSTANMGFFSSDRTISEYAEQIWDVHPCPLPRVVEGANGQAVVRQTKGKPGSQTVGSLRRHHQGSLVKDDVIPAAREAPQRSTAGSKNSREDGEDGGIPIEL
ncbi:glycogen phosphorylase [Tritrichomonas foetus]|uniref:Alpha-1,4 glucan phosphorylase n=1 Tax=Tritrichomonas foetus TaxID=1144522 RepID=A0A1J4K3K8_9EUKA|nr:glycogen phosphorylase [Tritrichomonas foetus]|eukprot:OHT05959.1 glycogen phosphorylase [Tritrichomonas foetus]